MRLHPALSRILILAVLVLPNLASAQEPADGTLRVVRPIIHGEQDRAEICLEFDHALEGSDRGRAALNLKLEADGKNQPVPPATVSLLSNLLCVDALDYRRPYHLTLGNVRGAQGEKLSEAYHFSFTIPDRKPVLTFASEQNGSGFVRWTDNDPVLRATNVPHVKVELFRVTDAGTMAEAWRQRAQTILAPTESAYAARKNGQLVWQGDMTFDDAPNKILEQKIPLQSAGAALTPGLYLVAASAPVAKNLKKKDVGLAPLAALWLLRSDLKTRAFRDTSDVYAAAQKSDGLSALKDVHITIEDQNHHILADGKSDSDGIAHIKLNDDKQATANLLVATTDAGDMDFADLTQAPDKAVTINALDAAITADKDFYTPGDSVTVAFSASDIHGHAVAQNDSRLQILRPDRSLYATLPLPKNADNAQLSFPAPFGNGVWPLVWQASDGHTLTEGTLRMTSNPDAPRLEASADRGALGEDNEVVLSLKSLTVSNKAAPFIAGRIYVAATRAEPVAGNWGDYRFGAGDAAEGTRKFLATFITDAGGEAHIKLNVPSLGEASARAVAFTVESDTAAGAADPAPLILPFKPNEYSVGIKSLSADNKFAENSVARFGIIAIDGSGQRRGADNLSYQIYEEGRSFDWYQADGRWDYKPQQQQRRMGGGPLNIRADGGTVIEWPVTAGTYHIDIRNNEGVVLARLTFTAGWTATPNDAPKSLPLAVNAPAAFTPGTDTAIRFKLDQPALLTAVIADDQIRKIIHGNFAAGDNDVSFNAAPDWGNRLRISIMTDAPAGGRSAQITLMRQRTNEKTAKTTAIAAPAFAITASGPFILQQGDNAQFTVTLRNNSAASGAYRYILTATPGLKLTGGEGNATLTLGQSRVVTFNLSALQTGARDIKLDVAGHNIHLSQSWAIAVEPANAALEDRAQPQIAAQQSWSPAADDKNRRRGGIILVAQQPLFDTPEILSALLDSHTFATRALGAMLEILRLWRDTIIGSSLLTQPSVDARTNALIKRLLARQNTDGSFPVYASGDADIAATTAALIALNSNDNPLAKRGADQAAGWLKARLGNSWFEEKERAERAAAYAALAATGRQDIANLYYFGDTSLNKDMPVLARMQLAYAFAKNNDADKSRAWLAGAGIDANSSAIPSALLPYLADDVFFDPNQLAPALEKLSATLTQANGFEISSAEFFLHAMYDVQARAGATRIAVNSSEQDLKNILALNLPENGIFSIHNAGNKPVFAVWAQRKAVASIDAVLQRHIYRLNGGEIMPGDILTRNETYLILLEGNGPSGSSLLVYDDPAPALDAVSCALSDPISLDEALHWIVSINLTPVTMCEKSGGGVDAVLNSSEGANWRMAYLARARGPGDFGLNAPGARSLTAEKPDRHQGAVARVRVQ